MGSQDYTDECLCNACHQYSIDIIECPFCGSDDITYLVDTVSGLPEEEENNE